MGVLQYFWLFLVFFLTDTKHSWHVWLKREAICWICTFIYLLVGIIGFVMQTKSNNLIVPQQSLSICLSYLFSVSLSQGHIKFNQHPYFWFSKYILHDSISGVSHLTTLVTQTTHFCLPSVNENATQVMFFSLSAKACQWCITGKWG